MRVIRIFLSFGQVPGLQRSWLVKWGIQLTELGRSVLMTDGLIIGGKKVLFVCLFAHKHTFSPEYNEGGCVCPLCRCSKHICLCWKRTISFFCYTTGTFDNKYNKTEYLMGRFRCASSPLT